MPHVKAGKLRVIGVGSPKRLPSIPECADHRRAGLRGLRDFAVVRPVRAREDAGRGRQAPRRRGGQSGEEPGAVAERYKADDAEAVGSTPQEYADFIAKEQARWKDVIQRANIKID